MSNPIRDTSKLYNDLSTAYENTSDKIERFEKCYILADKATYNDIHYVISMLRENNSLGAEDSLFAGDFTDIVKGVLKAFTGKTHMKHAFLLDILEEARERKRPSNF